MSNFKLVCTLALATISATGCSKISSDYFRALPYLPQLGPPCDLASKEGCPELVLEPLTASDATLVNNLVPGPDTWDMGERPIPADGSQAFFESRFRIRNVGSGAAKELQLVSAASAILGLSNNQCGNTLEAGANCLFSIQFRPNQISQWSKPLSVRYKASAGRSLMSRPEMQAVVMGSGSAPGSLHIPHPDVDGLEVIQFDSVQVGASRTIALPVNEAGAYPASNVNISYPAGFSGVNTGAVNDCLRILALPQPNNKLQNGNCVLSVRFSPTAAMAQSNQGVVTGNMTIQYSAGTYSRTYTRALRGVASTNPTVNIAAIPNLARTLVGSTANFNAAVTYTIGSSGTLSIGAASFLPAGSPFTVVNSSCPTNPTVSGGCSLSLRFAPTAPQSYSSTLSIAYNNGSAQTATTSVVAEGGILGTVSRTGTATHTFPETMIGSQNPNAYYTLLRYDPPAGQPNALLMPLASVSFVQSHPSIYPLGSSNCSSIQYLAQPNGTSACEAYFYFQPNANPVPTGTVTFSAATAQGAPQGSFASLTLNGTVDTRTFLIPPGPGGCSNNVCIGGGGGDGSGSTPADRFIINFNTRIRGESVSLPITLGVAGVQNGSIAGNPSAPFSVSTPACSPASGGRCTFTVGASIAANEALGLKTSLFQMNYTGASSGTVYFELKVTVAEGASVGFQNNQTETRGPVTVNTTSQFSLSLRNTGDAAAGWVNVTSTDPAITYINMNNCLNVGAGQDCLIFFNYTAPATAGTRTVAFSSTFKKWATGASFPGEPFAAKNVSISVEPPAPQAQLATTGSLGHFGNFNPGAAAPAPRTITLTNSGGAASVGVRAQFASGASPTFSLSSNTCSGGALAAGASCSVSVTYTPGSAIAASTATLQFVNAATGGSVGVANLYASGTVIQDMSISAAGSTTCVVDEVGGVQCWGGNESSQFGNASAPGQSGTPFAANLGGAKAVKVAVGGTHVCAMMADSTLKCWGANGDGQVGVGISTAVVANPTTINVGGAVVDVAAGFTHTCVILSGGNVKCWGGNASGQLGYNDTQDRNTPPSQAVDLRAPAASISAGGGHTCVITTTGQAKCWGGNFFTGALGQKNNVNYGSNSGAANIATLPPIDLGSGFSPSAIAAGSDFTVVRSASGAVKAFGFHQNSNGKLGMCWARQGGENNSAAAACWAQPSWTPALSYGWSSMDMGDNLPAILTGVSHISAGRGHACARFGAIVKCWGSNSVGQLGAAGQSMGDNQGEMASLATVQGPAGPLSVIGLATGDDHSCAISKNAGTLVQTVYCWGSGLKFANGTSNNSPTPYAVLTR